MNTKLTLNVEKKVVEKAKEYARKKGTSISGIVENYLKIITGGKEDQDIEITPLVKELSGSFKIPGDFDYKGELTKGLSEKYS